jgi:hypothetical protein
LLCPISDKRAVRNLKTEFIHRTKRPALTDALWPIADSMVIAKYAILDVCRYKRITAVKRNRRTIIASIV